ncbi:DUF3060 domain-containing protein [Mycobacterium stomatepiae]|nr:DUF3060 domain-containing protein [Mycobacterium stomatepiae]MCV7163717.1 DUF3060 domain-containing protein [Mycobacterium stomatepiae]
MESQDDPEKRIRDLERPLAETARASELGGTPQGGHAYPPPPPGPVPPPLSGSVPPPPPMYNYGGPYGGPSPTSSGNRLWWIVGTVIVIGVLALAGGIAAFAAHQISGVRSIINSEISTTPSTSSRVTTSPRTTTRSPRSSTSAPPTTSGPSTLPLPPQAAPLDVSGIDENKTIVCNDNVVTVSGINNTIVITGHCASLTVSGMKNSVTVDSSDAIDASGMNNQVTFHSGSPKISNSGVDNVVAQG